MVDREPMIDGPSVGTVCEYTHITGNTKGKGVRSKSWRKVDKEDFEEMEGL